MTNYVTGRAIKRLREKKGYTQKQLAALILVSDKAISKWESGRGLPDVSLLEPLAKALGVSVAELLSGACVVNQNRCGNIRKSRFYVCPVCRNVLYALGEGAFSCCGVTLPPLEAEQADGEHEMRAEQVENEYFVSMRHPIEKTHYISFFAFVTADKMTLVKLYPEQAAETRFPICGHGVLYAYCNRHGLLSVKL